MVQTPKYLLVEERLGEPLAPLLEYWRHHGVSYEAMARMLETDSRVPLTGQTIADWFMKLDSAVA